MEISSLDIKVLKFIASKKEAVKTENIKRKFGKWGSEQLDKLYDLGYIECPLDSHDIQFCMPRKDDWKITDKGLYYLAEHKTEVQLTGKQAILNQLLGAVFGIVGTLVTTYLSGLLKL